MRIWSKGSSNWSELTPFDIVDCGVFKGRFDVGKNASVSANPCRAWSFPFLAVWLRVGAMLKKWCRLTDSNC